MSWEIKAGRNGISLGKKLFGVTVGYSYYVLLNNSKLDPSLYNMVFKRV